MVGGTFKEKDRTSENVHILLLLNCAYVTTFFGENPYFKNVFATTNT